MTDTEETFWEKIIAKKITDINVGYRTFTINIKRGLKEENHKCFGVTDFDKGVILLERDMDTQTARETLFHELSHVALELCGLGGEEGTGLIREQNNEDITRISRSFLLLMNLNKDIFKGLLEG